MTEVIQMDAQRARQRVDRIKVGLEGVWQLVVESWEARDWDALGYKSWDEMCTREFGAAHLRLPREERQEVVASLRDQGMSIRAIASAANTGTRQVQEALRQVSSQTTPVAVAPEQHPTSVDEQTGEVLHPTDEAVARIEEPTVEAGAPAPVVEPSKPVTGLDGKTYSPQSKTTPSRKPLPEAAKNAGWELRKSMERIEKLVEDPRYRQNVEQVATALRGHLLYVAETVAAVLDQLP